MTSIHECESIKKDKKGIYVWDPRPKLLLFFVVMTKHQKSHSMLHTSNIYTITDIDESIPFMPEEHIVRNLFCTEKTESTSNKTQYNIFWTNTHEYFDEDLSVWDIVTNFGFKQNQMEAKFTNEAWDLTNQLINVSKSDIEYFIKNTNSKIQLTKDPHVLKLLNLSLIHI